MKNKRWLRSVAFLLLLVIAVTGVLQCYGIPRTYVSRAMATFYAEDENIIDGVAIGTSVISYAWMAPESWKNYGLTIYQLGTSLQPFGAIPEYLNYARKKQDIKYAIIDVHGLRKEAILNSLSEGYFKMAYLDIPDLAARTKILNSLLDYAEEAYDYYGRPEGTSHVNLENKFSYYFPFLSFHNRWVDGLKKTDYKTIYNVYLGVNERKNSFQYKDFTSRADYWEYEPLEDIDDFQKKQLQNVFDYGKENNIELLFISLPSFRSREEQQELGALLDYCKKQGYNTIDFATDEVVEATDFDISTDVLNSGHINSKGGIKVTNYICQYLIDNGYTTTDHRGDERYKHWDVATENYQKYYKSGWAASSTN